MKNNETELIAPTNPFAAKSAGLATVQIESERAVTEVQAAMILARRFPRDPVAAMERILNACTRPTLAEGALYSYSRGGSDITGPSIRLAEAIAQVWGNMQFGIRELEQRGGESTVEAFAWDVETNTRQVKVFQVPHIRYSKSKGNSKLTDPRDIYELVANNGARRLRACILGVIPGDVVEEAVKQCEVTLQTSVEVTPEGIKKMVSAFEKIGVTKAQLEKRIQRRVDTIQAAQMVSLRKIFASIQDGMSTAADWFEDLPKGPSFNQSQPEAGGSQAEPVTTAAVVQEAKPPVETPAEYKPEDAFELDGSPPTNLEILRDAMAEDEITVTDLRAFVSKNKLMKNADFVRIADIPPKLVDDLVKSWDDVRAGIVAVEGGGR